MRGSSRLLACALIVGLPVLTLGARAFGQGVAVVDSPPSDAQGLDPQAAALEAGRRLELAEAILAARDAAGGRSLDAGYRTQLKTRLAKLSLPQLESLQRAGGEGNLGALLDAVPNALGDSSADLVYTPVNPCRVFDTRFSAAGILVGGTQRNFLIAGSSGFTTQGGNASGCGIPFGPATAVIINFAAVTPAGAGNLRAWAVASPQPAAPNAAVMNFSPALPALANGIAVPICDPAVTTCASEMRLQADASSVHVVGDVVGYFRAFAGAGGSSVPIAYGFINSNGSVAAATSNVTSLYDGGASRYVITIAGESYFYNSYVTVVTPVSQNLTWNTDSSGGSLLVSFRTTAGVATQPIGFQFVTFKP